MNNLALASLIGGVGVFFFAQHQHEISALTGATAANAEKISALEQTAMRSRDEARRIERLFVTEQEELTRRRAFVNGEASAAIRNAPTDEPTSPEKEGFFPADRPYFYLSKSRLAGLLYWPLGDKGAKESLKSNVAELFGMSGEEFERANSAYKELLNTLRSTEAAVAIPTNTPVQLANDPGKKSSMFIPKLSEDQVAGIDQQFRAAMVDAIGSERGELLARRIGETYANGAYGLGQERTITMVHDEEGVMMSVITSGGSSSSSRDSDEDRRHKVPPHFLHLFPQE